MFQSNLGESFVESMKNNMDKNFFKDKLKKELTGYFQALGV